MLEQVAVCSSEPDDEYLLKHVNAVALMPVPGGRRISLLGRRLFNVLLYRAQEEGEREEYEARMHEILGDSAYNSNNTAPVKKILRELMSTTVEWQSPTNGEIETWDACNLLSGAGLTKDKRTGAVTVRWRFDSKVRSQLLSPDRYARLSLEAITQLSTHAAMALYEICARYVDNPSHKTARQHWRWWRPVLIGISTDNSKTEYRFFKRDVLHKAVAEINTLTNLEVKGPIEFKERDNKTIAEIQFEVRLKTRATSHQPKSLADIDFKDLPIIGRGINAGVKQHEVESLLRKHGVQALTSAIEVLERRIEMPIDKVVPVHKPGSWLKTYMERSTTPESFQDKNSNRPPNIVQENIKKHRAAWTDEWLRRRKDELRKGFSEYTDEVQKDVLELFRQELKRTSQPQFLKRFENSGWQHRMLREMFTKFLGLRNFGEDWDKPTLNDILAIAAELASNNPEAAKA